MFSNIIISAIGKTSDDFFSIEQHYTKLIKTNIIFKISKPLSHLDIQEQVTLESNEIYSKIDKKNCIISLDSNGKEFTSKEFSSFLNKQSLEFKNLSFLIGGSHGISKQVKDNSNYLISLSKLTLPHLLARILLLEQIYRAETILLGSKYHK